MEYPFTEAFDKDFQLAAMMGPNAMRITEELLAFLPRRPGMRILDLGCGMGLSSVLLAKKLEALVFAADLWIAPEDNWKRFASLGLEDRIIPVSVDVTRGLPFSRGYFDLIICVDAYHYFGCNDTALPGLLPYLREGGRIAAAIPGLKEDFHGKVPEELQPYWQPDFNFHSLEWWKELWQREPCARLGACREMTCCRQAWDDWLASSNPYALQDREMMRAEGGKYFALVQLIAEKQLERSNC